MSNGLRRWKMCKRTFSYAAQLIAIEESDPECKISTHDDNADNKTAARLANVLRA